METTVARKTAIIGSGLMGSGIALIFARSRYPVTLFDTQEQALIQAKQSIRSDLEQMAEHGIGDKCEIEAILDKVSTSSVLAEAVDGASIVIECAPENLDLKQNLFAELDSLCPKDTILATNTSVISITEIAQKARYKDRIIGTHFWNPPFLIPLVEVIMTEHTSEEVMSRMYNLLKKLGKHPIRVNKDVPGFVANRLQHAIWREALSMVEHGIADAQTVDEALRYGPGLRWPILGILENADMIGLDLTLNIHSYILKFLEDAHEPSKLLQELVGKGDLGFKTGKGYQKWTKEQIDTANKRLRDYLIDVTKDLK